MCWYRAVVSIRRGEKVRALVINHIPSVAAEQAIVHRYLTCHAVKCLYRTAKIVLGQKTVGKFLAFAVEIVINHQIGCRKRKTVVVIVYCQSRGYNLIAVIAKVSNLDAIHRQHARTVVGKQRGLIDKLAILGKLKTQSVGVITERRALPNTIGFSFGTAANPGSDIPNTDVPRSNEYKILMFI